ncbi:MAG: twin-arginine translocase TatA/TatE family subunit [Candidatus Rokubacteria bacterium]|nr:twin-arginine translocase TatA/TatE family subunit [Candidatus Rokubacteria bacterium]MBI3827036.1 twin-arginine translocase TatA/TatE family subunit [Candidatus Rokubacteria bacterium]
MLVIGVIALLVFGPSKLPELGRMFGRAMREFRRASDEFRSTVETNLQINEPEPQPAPSELTSARAASEPAAVAAPVEAASGAEVEGGAAPPPAEPFCARRGARLFHRSECGWAKGMPEMDRVYLKRVTDAKDQGFMECPVCEPWESAS